MPGRNRTGPEGYGAMTGRGAGYCAGHGASGYGRYGGGRARYGYHAYGGRGFGYHAHGGYMADELTPEGEILMLKEQAKYLEREAAAIAGRIRELEEISEEKHDN